MRPRPDAPLGPLNTLALDARARALVAVANESDLREALTWARQRELPVIPLGEGSNVVLAGDLPALVLQLASRGVRVLQQRGDRVRLRVAAGQDWHALVEWSLGEGFYGLENLALIPGTAGAAPIQNIGAYGVELASLLHAVHCVRIADGEAVTLGREDCGFAYRDSIFKRELRDQYVITEVDLELSREAAPSYGYPLLAAELAERGTLSATPHDVFRAVVDIRRRKLPDPAKTPNAGSFFKNPVVDPERAQVLREQFAGLPGYTQDGGRVKLPAAWLIEYCGWKGHRSGGVGVHPEHALVLANYGADDGAVLLELAARIRDSVRRTFGVELEIEPRIYGLPG